MLARLSAAPSPTFWPGAALNGTRRYASFDPTTFIKRALIYLALSLMLGALLAARSALGVADDLAAFSARVLSLVHGRLG